MADGETKWLGKLKDREIGAIVANGYLDVRAVRCSCDDCDAANERFLKIKVIRLRQPDKNGNQYSVAVDDWRPDPSREQEGREMKGGINRERPKTPRPGPPPAQPPAAPITAPYLDRPMTDASVPPEIDPADEIPF